MNGELQSSFLYPLVGGVLIGLAVSLMLFLNGRVTGVSGIVKGALVRPNREGAWRWSFIAGLLAGGVVLNIVYSNAFVNEANRSLGANIIAGLLVGFGTAMGGGCTSGHGVCGVSRLSLRSIVATLVFIIFGIVTATLIRTVLGGV